MQASKQIEQEYWRLVRESVNLEEFSSLPFLYITFCYFCALSHSGLHVQWVGPLTAAVCKCGAWIICQVKPHNAAYGSEIEQRTSLVVKLQVWLCHWHFTTDWELPCNQLSPLYLCIPICICTV
jgi:hypothetical protein